MIRFGVATKILGRPELRTRPVGAGVWPHLSIGLLYLRDVLIYLAGCRVGCYRLPDELAPAGLSVAEIQAQIAESAGLLAEVCALAQAGCIRLTMHLPLHYALASPDSALAGRALAAIEIRARLLAALGAGAEGTLVLHVGGAYGDGRAAIERFATLWEQLTDGARRQCAVEPDEDSFDLADLLPLHQMTGVPLVLDTLHFQLHNRRRIALAEGLGLALATWPPGIRPKIHISSQRTEGHLRLRQAGEPAHVVAPRRGQHADFLNPFEVMALLRAARGLPAFDAMIEAKAGDLALLRLREDLQTLAPELAAGVE